MAEMVDWKSVVTATLHPIQIEILEAAAAIDRLSPAQFCGNRTDIARVAYHFRALHKLGMLEPAGTASRRGATEHFYRLSRVARG